MILSDPIAKVKVTQLNRRSGEIERSEHKVYQVSGQQVVEVSRPMKNDFIPGVRAKLYFKGGLDPKGVRIPRTQITISDDISPELLKDIEAGDYVHVKFYQPYPESPQTLTAIEVKKCTPEEVAKIVAEREHFSTRRIEVVNL